MLDRHGQIEPVDLPTFFGQDPELAMIRADPVAWALAHPCECEDLCTCDDREGE